MMIKISKKLYRIPTYPFIELEKIKDQLLKKGIDVISFAIGDPDLPPHKEIIKALKESTKECQFHRYPFGQGTFELRESIAKWCKKRFNVTLDPETEILVLIGSKEGIGHLPFALIDKNEYVLIPDPCYPVYWRSVILSGGIPYFMPLLKENNYLPDLKKIPKNILKKTKLMFINYPNNPTTAIATKDFFENVIEFALKYNIPIAHDAAYSEIYFDEKPISLLSIKNSKDIAVEFHSFSKTYSMPGFRIGWVCGNKTIIEALTKLKDNIDSGVFFAIQKTAVAALRLNGYTDYIRKIYKERRDILIKGLKELNWQVDKPKATFYVWAETKNRVDSNKFSKYLLEKTGILVAPGSSFGKYGEGFIRFSLTLPTDKIRQAINRLKNLKW